MIHPVEVKSWALVEHLLAQIDPQHEGWAIDAGLGADDWWFVKFCALGYRTVAIDPVFGSALSTAIEYCDFTFVDILAATNGKRKLFLSRDENLHTAIKERLGGKGPAVDVDAINLNAVNYQCDIQRLTVLKLDIEGMEPEVISSLKDTSILPDILIFEFGGFYQRDSRKGPWSIKNVTKVDEAIRTLDKLGYGAMWAATDVDEHPFLVNADNWFGRLRPETGYGNIIAVQEAAFNG